MRRQELCEMTNCSPEGSPKLCIVREPYLQCVKLPKTIPNLPEISGVNHLKGVTLLGLTGLPRYLSPCWSLMTARYPRRNCHHTPRKAHAALLQETTGSVDASSHAGASGRNPVLGWESLGECGFSFGGYPYQKNTCLEHGTYNSANPRVD